MGYNHVQKLYGQLRKTALSLTPQAMYNQFKRPSAGSVIEHYYIHRFKSNESRDHYQEDGYLPLREEIFAVADSKSSEIRGIYFRVPCPYHKLRGIYFRVSSCISEFLLYFIANFVIKYDDKQTKGSQQRK